MERKYNNLKVENSKQVEAYKTTGRSSSNYPKRDDYKQHGEKLVRSIRELYQQEPIKDVEEKLADSSYKPYKDGIKLTFISKKGYDIKLESLENKTKNIRITNLTEKDEVLYVTVFIPNESRSFFIKRINDYLDEEKLTRTNKRSNQDLINGIEDIKGTIVDSFWTDGFSEIPQSNKEWCEIWLWYDFLADNLEEEIQNTLSNLYALFNELEIEYTNQEIIFSDTIVTIARVNYEDISDLVKKNHQISEIRLNNEPNTFFTESSVKEQIDWVDDLLNRVNVNVDENSPTVCILDTGINSSHPLVKPFIKSEKVVQSSLPGVVSGKDEDGHGSSMSGIAIYFDLKKALISQKELTINHGIESVKIFSSNYKSPENLYGSITSNAVYQSEIENPNNKIYCLAVTGTPNGSEPGSATQWSATIDKLSFEGNRLFTISAGNIHPYSYGEEGLEYPDLNIITSVEDPAQAWNALTIGAYNKNSILIDDEDLIDFNAVSKSGELSPYSTTSSIWDNKYPNKPDVVFDGGNMMRNSDNYYDSHDNLSLLTTNGLYLDFHQVFFTTLNATSSATAQSSQFAASLWSEYSNMWPETIRGLIVHSSSWTDQMVKQFNHDNKKRTGIRNLLRACGYGVPDFSKAILSSKNSVNLIIESEIQPYQQEMNNEPKYNEVHFHEIPWPKELLEELGNNKIRLKYTLSYFIEPSPNNVGWMNKYVYPSYRFSFDIIQPTETRDEFRARITDELKNDNINTKKSTSKWFIGSESRDNGSVHSDFFEDTAINLSTSNYIAVYPQSGWWKSRKGLKKANSKTRYSLMITIETVDSDLDIDLYTPIQSQITNIIEI